MKTLLIIIINSLLSVAILAQTVTVRFENTTNKNYEVKIDGKSYYSTITDDNGKTKQRSIRLDELAPGMHKLDVLVTNSDNSVNSEAPIYSNTFQLRQGYDMVIAIRRNEQVTFTEKAISNTTVSKSRAPMTEADFDILLKSVSNKWSQSARLTAAKAGLNNKNNYFTTEQVGQLISLLTAENHKVELAKLSYAKVTDPENFPEMYTLFRTETSRNELEKFVSTKNNSATGISKPDPYNNRPVMANAQFNALLRTVKNQYQQEGKAAVLTDEFNREGQYFSTSQIRQLLSNITSESNRLNLAKLAYARVSDIVNFSSLNNLFIKQASRDELNYYIKYGGNPVATDQFVNRIPMTDAEFRKLHQKAALHIRQSSVVTDVKNAFTNTTNYYNINQVKTLLGLIASEADRVALAKLAFHRVTEPTAYPQVLDMFDSEASKEDLIKYINSVVRNQ